MDILGITLSICQCFSGLFHLLCYKDCYTHTN
ncbi:hypothetical protein GLYMA_16G200050v4 [Glycine max]|nr:hypothetical protein GLYMA_16G200050v4 [Glycine max]KAH1152096.1 hypothetical protein GYH30_045542 [Glycine max]